MDFNLLYNTPLPKTRLKKFQTDITSPVHDNLKTQIRKETKHSSEVTCVYRYILLPSPVAGGAVQNHNHQQLMKMRTDLRVNSAFVMPLSLQLETQDLTSLLLNIKIPHLNTEYMFHLNETYIKTMVAHVLDDTVQEYKSNVNISMYMNYLHELQSSFRHPFTDTSLLRSPGFCFNVLRQDPDHLTKGLKALKIYRHLDMRYLYAAIGNIVSRNIEPNKNGDKGQIMQITHSPHTSISDSQISTEYNAFKKGFNITDFYLTDEQYHRIDGFIAYYIRHFYVIQDSYIEPLFAMDQPGSSRVIWIEAFKLIMKLATNYISFLKLFQIIIFCIHVILKHHEKNRDQEVNACAVLRLMTYSLSEVHARTTEDTMSRYYTSLNIMIQYCIFLGRIVNRLPIHTLNTHSKCELSAGKSHCQYTFNINTSRLKKNILQNNKLGKKVLAGLAAKSKKQSTFG